MDINIYLLKEQFEVEGQIIKKGTEITVDGTTGKVYLGMLPLGEVKLPQDLKKLMGWVDGFKHLGVMANADTPEMIKKAIQFGAEGIGLCRRERMSLHYKGIHPGRQS